MDLFLLQVLLSFVVGGLYISLMTVLSEKVGTKVGGVLTGLPSTGLIGLIFIDLTQNAHVMKEAAKIMPASIALSTIFLIFFVHFYKNNTYLAYFKALTLWLVFNGILLSAGIQDIKVFIIIALILFIISIQFFKKYKNTKLEKIKLPKRAIIFRFIFSGSLVALAVLFAKLSGPQTGGVLASFPAAFSATLLILTPLHGIDFIKSLSKGLVMGAFTISSFAVGVFILTEPLGSLYSLSLSFILSIFMAICFIKFAK